MRTSRLVKLVTLAGLVTILTLAGCARAAPTPTPVPAPTPTPAPAPAPTPKPAPTPSGPYGELRMALGTLGPEGFNPPRAGALTTTGIILAPFMDAMFWRDRPGETPRPGIVEKWEMAADGLSWTYYIRRGVKFHNGEDLKADDVKFSIEQYMAKDVYSPETKNEVQRVELVDDYTLRLYTKGIQLFLTELGHIVARHGWVMPKDYLERYGMAYFERHPIGSGPFRFVRYVPGDFLEYEALEKHWRKTPAFKKLVVILMPEESTRVAVLKTGDADVIEVGLEAAVDLERIGYRTFLSEVVTPRIEIWAAYDQRRAAGMPITDIRVRQALSLAIDRQEMMKTFFLGKATPALPHNILESYDDDYDIPYWREYAAKSNRYDPAEAKRLLKEAGYPDGFRLKLYTYPCSAAAWLPKMAEIIQGYWLKIGVKAEMTLIELGQYTTWRHGPMDPLVGAASTMRWAHSLSYPPARQMRGWHSNASIQWFTPDAIPGLDKLIDDVQVEFDPAKRREMLAKMMKMGTDSYVNVTLCTVPAPAVLGHGVDLDFPTPLPSPYLPTLAAWYTHRK